MFTKETLEKYLEMTKSKEMPGGGSVVGYTGSLGAALAMMVSNLTTDKKSYQGLSDDIKERFQKDYDRLNEIADELLVMCDEDANSFQAVLDAMALPKETEEEKKARSAQIQEGYKTALEVPFKTCELCLEGLKLNDVFAEYGNIWAITDQGCSTLLLAASGEAALLNVIINLKSIKDEEYKAEIVSKMEQYRKEMDEYKERYMNSCYSRLEKME
ncbi:MAG: cyclodeaminase/cyclohydrolase family protein [Gallicola sp.]|nr:cyclodeaminase/cyclohydrolase family protein [Gallicola sp.]